MISASMLSCYSALSSRILTTNHLITFLTLHSCYPVLQSINTYHSLIGAVYVFRLCALFSPHISSPSLSLYYIHVFPISCNCLAPPHFPESPHRAFIPQCTYSPHQSLAPCEFFLLHTYFLLSLYLSSVMKFRTYSLRFVIPVSCFLFPVSCFLFPVSYFGLACFLCHLPMSSKSCVYILHLSLSVSLFSFDFVAPPPSVCFTLCIVYVWSFCCVYRNIDFLVLTLILCSRRQLSCPVCVLRYM